MIRSFDGHTPKIHPTAFISEAAYVVGEVEIGPRSSVWPGAVIRGDHGLIKIGSDTNIQDNSVIHSDAPATIEDFVTIGHRVVCHAKHVGSYVLLGNGCVLNDAVVVENRSIVAAGAVVLENRIINSGTIWAGIPAKLHGRLMKKHYQYLEDAASNYVKLGASYKDSDLGN